MKKLNSENHLRKNHKKVEKNIDFKKKDYDISQDSVNRIVICPVHKNRDYCDCYIKSYRAEQCGNNAKSCFWFCA